MFTENLYPDFREHIDSFAKNRSSQNRKKYLNLQNSVMLIQNNFRLLAQLGNKFLK